MVTYICPNCGHKEIIGMEIRISNSNTPSEKSCPECGTEMEKE